MKEEWAEEILAAVYEASAAIMKVFTQDFEVFIKDDDSPVTKADKESNDILVTALKKTGIIVVSEEQINVAYAERANQTIWLVDPLDGTKEFISKRDEFCICIALIENNQPVFGLIASPVEQRIIFGGTTISPALISYGEKDIFNEAHRLPPVSQDKVENFIYSRTHYTPNIDIIVRKVEEIYGPCGRILKGSAMKFFDLVTDRAQIYPRLWPTMEWDIAAGHAIYDALGGEIVEFSTFASLQYNKESLFNPKFIAKPKHLKIE